MKEINARQTNTLISLHRTHLCLTSRRIQTGSSTLNAFVATPAHEERVLVTFARAKVTLNRACGARPWSKASDARHWDKRAYSNSSPLHGGIMKYYKAEFTRVGGQGIKDGWQAVNISPDTPPEVIGRYSAHQNANTPPAPKFDSDDCVQSVTELQTDSYNAYLSRIRYGLADSQGRPSMHSDSFIFELKQFCESPDEALKLLTDDSQQPHDFEVTPLLMKCVYSVLTSRAGRSLYVICDDYCVQTIAGIMSAIYSALFPPFRKYVTFSTHTQNIPKTIIFKRRITAETLNYIDLRTGETNVPTLKKFDDYGFIDEVLQVPRVARSNYFKSFESALQEYGCAESVDLSLYKLVWETETIDSLTDFELLKKFNELLGINVPNVRLLHNQIVSVLVKLLQNKVHINDVLTAKIATLTSRTSHEVLFELCVFWFYSNLPFEDYDDNRAIEMMFDFVDGIGEVEVITVVENEQPEIIEIDMDDEYDEYE